jgi:hypothetical protein
MEGNNMNNEPTNNAPAGWYPDAENRLHYWDGQQWTPVDAPTAAPEKPEWYRKPWVIGLGAVVALLVIIGIFAGEDESNNQPVAEEVEPTPEPEPTIEPTPEPTVEPTPEPVVEREPQRNSGPNLGDDPYLNGLVTRCADGDTEACDTLFWESPLGSDYEDWASDQLWGTGDDGEYSDNIQLLALQMSWDEMSPAERADICQAWDLLGAELAAETFVDGAGGSFSTELVIEFFNDACSVRA